MVIVLRYRGRTEGIGLDQVGAGSQVLLMDFLDDVRLRQRQQLIIALDEQLPAGAGEVLEALAAIVFLGQLVLLDHGAHCAIQDQDAARQLRSRKWVSVADTVAGLFIILIS